MVSSEGTHQQNEDLVHKGNAITRQRPGTRNRLFQSITEHPKCTFRLFITVVLILISAVIAVAVVKSSPSCANNTDNTTCCSNEWIGHRGSCYYVSKDEGKWESSQDFCTSFKASLVKMSSKEKSLKAFIMLQRGTNSIWLGLRKLNGTWRWSDGEEERDMKIGGNGGDCAYLDKKGMPIATRCTTPHHWICSKPAIC